MLRLERHCQECGTAYVARRKASAFCSQTCRSAFNNRRATRGAQLYDLYMAHRYERAEADGMLSVMNRMAESWRNEDKAQREGRHSWGNWKSFLLERLDLSSAIRLERMRIGRLTIRK